MGRLRRRRKRYTWLPQIGFQGADEENDNVVLPFSFPTVTIDGNLSDVLLFPVIPDAPNEIPTAVTDHLGDFLGNEYFLRRIVGKIAIACPNITADETHAFPFSITFGAGFFVARADTNPSNNPVGTSTATLRKENYGPLNLGNTREPWIWRRTWVLSPQLVSGSTTLVRQGVFPQNNYLGSVAEGSHIDAKTARRVTSDERLWVALQACCQQPTTGSITTDHWDDPGIGLLDIRLLGAQRKARNRSAF